MSSEEENDDFGELVDRGEMEKMNFRRGGGMNRRVSRIETENANDVVSHLSLNSFRRSSLVNQVNMTDRSDDITRERMLNLELLQRKVQREDMKIFRHEVLQLIDEERKNRREANARFRMFRVVMVQCLKMIDLWEEGCEYMDSITNKNVLIGQRKDFMNEKIDKRLGLEMDNQGLRDEISALQKRLHDSRDENNSKDNRTAALKQNQADEKKEHMRLTGTIDKAKAGQKLLQQAMADAEVGLKDAFDTEELKELLSSNS